MYYQQRTRTSQKGPSVTIKHLIALIALALGLASSTVAAPIIASGNAGAGGGDVHTLAGGSPTGHGAEWRAVAGSKGDQFSGRESTIIVGSDSIRNGAEPS